MVHCSLHKVLAHRIDQRVGAGFGIFAPFVLCCLVLNSQDSDATTANVLNSPLSERDQETTESTGPRSTSTVDSIEDLFRNYSDDLSRLSAAYELIGKANETVLVDLFDQVIHRTYANEDDLWKAELIELVSSRLASMNLDKTVSLYESLPLDDAKYMLYEMMHVWARKDFDEAVEFGHKQDESVHAIVLRGIVDASLNLPATTLTDLGVELGDAAYVKRALATRQLELDLADPDKAWENLIDDPTIHLEENFVRVQAVAHAMIDKYGASEINNLLNAISSPILSYQLRRSTLTKIARNDPEGAFSFALDTPNDVYGTMLATVIDTWAIIDPENALSRVSLLPPSTVRDQLQERLVSHWIRQDPYQFETTLGRIPVELRDSARQSVIERLAEESIEAALKILPDINDTGKRQLAAQTIVDSWLNSDLDAALQWLVTSTEVESYRTDLLSSYLEQLTAEDADKAFDVALSLPIQEEGDVGLEVIVIDELSYTQTDRALRLLSRVRPGKTQLTAYESISSALVTSKRTDEAIDLGKQLPEEEQGQYYSNLAMDIATEETPTKILEVLPNVPVKEARSLIAEYTLLFRSSLDKSNAFSDEQVEELLQHVVPADLERVRFMLQP